jgi:peptide/nickel transport system ATP-binding protein
MTEPMNEQAPLVSVQNLKVAFRMEDGEPFQALKGISFDIPRNRTVALVGESGSGKSVTSMAILRLLPSNAEFGPDSRILFEGRDLLREDPHQLRKIRGGNIAMIFQEPMTSLNPVFTVGDQIVETLMLHMGMGRREAKLKAISLLKECGLPEPAKRVDAYPHELSGGQQQRVMIAMAIACEPKLLIADEPTTALDVTIQKQILKLVADLQKVRGMSVLFITHDLDVVGEFADEVVVMREGEIREHDAIRTIFENPRDNYTKALIKCRPHIGRRPQRLAVIDDFMQETPYVEPPHRPRGYGAEDEIILDVQGLHKTFFSKEGLFGKRAFHAVKDVSFKLAKGKTLGIVGESGSGKTTVGLTLMRLHDATAGKAFFNGKDILSMAPKAFKEYKRRIQIVFQNPYASLNPRFTIQDILTEPMMLHGIGADAQERRRLAGELADRVGLASNALAKYPHEFSGGQRQRIAIARCLTMKPDILICDESVSALDVSVQAQVLNLLQDLQDEFRLSYLFISHDLSVVKHISDQVMVMHEGMLVEQADADVIYANPQHDYTRELLASIPKGWPRGDDDLDLDGAIVTA